MSCRDFSSFWNRHFQPQSVSVEFHISSFPALDEIERDRVSAELPQTVWLKWLGKMGGADLGGYNV